MKIEFTDKQVLEEAARILEFMPLGVLCKLVTPAELYVTLATLKTLAKGIKP